MREGLRKYIESVSLKTKRRREEEEEERKKDSQAKSLTHPESIFIKTALRCQSKHSLAMQEGGVPTSSPLCIPLQQ